MTAYVTNAEKLITLSVIRSLGKKKITVTCGAEKEDAISFRSKYCSNKTLYPSPLKEAEFINQLENMLQKNKYDVLIPVFADTLLTISKNREKLSKYTNIPIAEHDKIEKALDKAETIKIAMENDIPCPKTYFVDKEQDIEDVKNKLDYPVVLKPTKSFGAKGVAYIKSPKDLISEYKKISSKYGNNLLVQECIPLEGEIYGCEALFNKDSKPRAVFIHKRLRQHPLTGGQSTLRVSVSHPEVERLGVKLLKALDWYGVAMVEFKIDPRDGKPKLMEINPRFWGSIHLPITAGVDFPYLLYRMAVDGDIETVKGYKLGIKSRALLPSDFRYLISALSDDFTHLGLKKPDKIRVLLDFMKLYEKDLYYELFSLDDPKPSLFEMSETISRKLRKTPEVAQDD
jgi:predicted ATP-grasp superfamily ATP-dependent carboligase